MFAASMDRVEKPRQRGRDEEREHTMGTCLGDDTISTPRCNHASSHCVQTTLRTSFAYLAFASLRFSLNVGVRSESGVHGVGSRWIALTISKP